MKNSGRSELGQPESFVLHSCILSEANFSRLLSPGVLRAKIELFTASEFEVSGHFQQPPPRDSELLFRIERVLGFLEEFALQALAGLVGFDGSDCGGQPCAVVVKKRRTAHRRGS